MPYDYVGCFSGSAIELPDGKQLFMYTGVRKEVQPGGGVRDIQTQCLATGDGMDYEKDPRNPILTVGDMTETAVHLISVIRRCGNVRMDLTAV